MVQCPFKYGNIFKWIWLFYYIPINLNEEKSQVVSIIGSNVVRRLYREFYFVGFHPTLDLHAIKKMEHLDPCKYQSIKMFFFKFYLEFYWTGEIIPIDCDCTIAEQIRNSQRNDLDKRTILIIRDERKTSKPFEKSIRFRLPFWPRTRWISLMIDVARHLVLIWDTYFWTILNNFW